MLAYIYLYTLSEARVVYSGPVTPGARQMRQEKAVLGIVTQLPELPH